jgi:hypothetical protein
MPRSPQEIIDAHLAAEFNRDYEAAVAFTSESIRYEFPIQGKCFSGRDNALRFYTYGPEERYRKAVAEGADLPSEPVLNQWMIDDTLVAEMRKFSVLDENGAVRSSAVGAVVVAGPDGVAVERIYVPDEMFHLLTDHVADALAPLLA